MMKANDAVDDDGLKSIRPQISLDTRASSKLQASFVTFYNFFFGFFLNIKLR